MSGMPDGPGRNGAGAVSKNAGNRDIPLPAPIRGFLAFPCFRKCLLPAEEQTLAALFMTCAITVVFKSNIGNMADGRYRRITPEPAGIAVAL